MRSPLLAVLDVTHRRQAMGVMLLLNDIPAMLKTLKDYAERHKNRHVFLEGYEKQIVEVYTAAVAERGANCLYDLVGGDVFNPGSPPRWCVTPEAT